MKISFKHVLVCVFVSIVLVQVYFGIVQIVQGFSSGNMIKSFSLKSLRKEGIVNCFVVGDTLLLVAESSLARDYRFKIYRNASMVLEREGDFSGSITETQVSLSLPMFSVGSYVVVFDAYGCGWPILGVNSFGTKVSAFEITATETKLTVNATYDNVYRGLSLRANLTDCEGYPVVNGNVSFGIRSSERQRPTDGWYPLGSSVTDDSGIATLDLVTCVSDGNYSFKASHAADENFGESSDIVNVEITSEKFGSGSCGFSGSSMFFALSASNGTFNAFASTSNPYSLMPLTVTAQYWIDSPFTEDVRMDYYLDNMNNHRGGHTRLTSRRDGALYVYYTTFYWESPDVYGLHSIYVTISIGSEMMQEYTEIARKQLPLNFQRCPSNLVVQWALSNYEGVLPVTAAFSKPRTYEVCDTGFSVSSSLAPKVAYCGTAYTVDAPLRSYPLKLYVNGTLQLEGSTNGDGVVVFPMHFGTTARHFALNVTVVADGCSLANNNSFKRIINFTRVDVQDVRNKENALFRFNYTVFGCGANSSNIYIGSNNTMKAEAFLFGLPVRNASLSFVVAQGLCSANVSGNAWIPNAHWADYLRVISINRTESNRRLRVDFNTGEKFYVDSQNCSVIPYAATNMTLWYEPIGDVNGDGRINVLDLIKVQTGLGSSVGDPRYNATYDLNLDGSINVLDLLVVSGNMGQNLTGLRTKGFVDLFKIILNKASATDNLGSASEVWAPESAGRYLVQVKTPQRFIATTAQYNTILYVDTILNRLKYVDVLKRPVNFTLDVYANWSAPQTTIIVTAYDSVIKKTVCNLRVLCWTVWYHNPWYEYAFWNGYTNSSGIVTWLWEYSEHKIHNFTVEPVDLNSTYVPSKTSVVLDVRYPTNLTSAEDNPIGVDVGTIHTFRFNLGLPWPPGLGNAFVRFRLNGTYTNGSLCVYDTGNYTVAGGNVSFKWFVPCAGSFSIKAAYNDVSIGLYLPSECYALANASVKPFALLFSVSKVEFSPGEFLTLNATVIDAAKNERYASNLVEVEFWRVGSDGSNLLIGSNMTHNGAALLCHVQYPNNTDAYAYMAKIKTSGDEVPQGIAGNPVQLTVSKCTRLLLNITEGDNYEHTIKGWLKSGSSTVGNKTVEVKVNETKYSFTTDQNGFFSKTLKLQAKDNKLTLYTVMSCFEGDQAKNVTAWTKTLDGQRYAACTTTQFGYKPSANSTTLTVQPQATETSTITKTPEQMQQEAKGIGLEAWGPDSFSLWPPFFKLHARVSSASLGLKAENWVGLFAFGVDSVKGLVYILHEALAGFSAASIDIGMSALISTITTTATLYSVSLIATTISQLSIAGIIATLALYWSAGTSALISAYLIPDVLLSKTVLLGVGFALIGLLFGAFLADTMGQHLTSILKQETVGGDYVMNAVKSLVNTFANKLIGILTLVSATIFSNLIMWPFAVATFVLAVEAIYWGLTRTV